MKVSYIIATRNRAYALPPMLDSIFKAFERAGRPEAEIVIVNNGSTDDTARTIAAWSEMHSIPLKCPEEPRPGKGRALNRAIRAANGDILALIDDDCRLHREHLIDLLRHYALDSGVVLRGGRVELGDPTDLPYTINTSPEKRQWRLADNTLRHEGIAGILNGCNMTLRDGSGKLNRGISGGSGLLWPRMAGERRSNEQTSPAESHSGVQGEGGFGRIER